MPKRPELNNVDRFLFVWLYHWFASVLGAVAIVRPETIIHWHLRCRSIDGARYMCRSWRPPSQGSRTFLSNHTDGITAVDLFVLPTIAFQILECLVVMRYPKSTAVLRAMGIRDRPIAPRPPWQNAYVERHIGSIRCECLDHMNVFGEAHLRRIVGDYAAYYNEARTHRS
jgi:hypothetical protein